MQAISLPRPKGWIKIAVSVVFAAATITFVASERSYALHFSPLSIVVFSLALIGTTVLAAVRFQLLARRQGTPITLGVALQANAAGALGSQFVFAFLGHAAGRIAVLHRKGMTAGTTISLSLLERIIAGLILGTAAVFGAVILFGRVTAGDESGYFLRVLVCLLIALAVVIGLVYRDFVPSATKGVLTKRFGGDLLVAGALSVSVHLTMLVAYGALAVGLGARPSAELVAACIVVMFAASLPISFGGWGIREMSAGVVLPLVGLTLFEGIVIGALIGIGTLAFQIAGGVLGTARPGRLTVPSSGDPAAARPDYVLWISVLTPVLTSIAIIFGLHLTTQAGVINVNLADPLAVLGSMMFAAYWLERRRPPVWLVSHLNLICLLVTAVVVLSALHGLIEFGFSAWGIRNRLIGWFVLLAYATTGALFVARLGAQGREILLKGFVVALCAIAAIELTVELLARLKIGIDGWHESYRFEGFSQNPNAYAFLLLAGLVIVIALLRKGAPMIWGLGGGLLLAVIFLTASRAGWGGAALVVFGAAAIDRRLIAHLLDLVLVGAVVTGLFFGLIELWELAGRHVSGASGQAGPSQAADLLRSVGATAYSDDERLATILGGWSLWTSYPLFGAGLGAYVEETSRDGMALTIHNSFLWIAAEMGLIGLAIFLAGGFHIFRSTWRRLRDASDEAAMVLILLSICFAAMALVHDLLYQRTLWFLAGACLAAPLGATRPTGQPFHGS